MSISSLAVECAVGADRVVAGGRGRVLEHRQRDDRGLRPARTHRCPRAPSAAAARGCASTGVLRQRRHGRCIADRRLADAASGGAGLPAAFLDRIEALIGTPDAPGVGRGTASPPLEAGSTRPQAAPISEARLGAVPRRRDLAAGTNGAFGRDPGGADGGRRRDRPRCHRHQRHAGPGRGAERPDPARLTARRSRRLGPCWTSARRWSTGIADVVPLRECCRATIGQVALIYTTGGRDPARRPRRPGSASRRTATIIRRHDAGLGRAVRPDAERQAACAPATSRPSPAGGSTRLSRSATRCARQRRARLDAVARDLVERFDDPAVDPTLAPGAAGLFTDVGAAFDPATRSGLPAGSPSTRPSIPPRGGDLWRLRDGLGAAAPGPAGSALSLAALAAALHADRLPGLGRLSRRPRAAAGGLSGRPRLVARRRRAATAETAAGYRRRPGRRRCAALEAAGGVDTDQEMQKLLLIEQSYAANARVIRPSTNLSTTLMGI